MNDATPASETLSAKKQRLYELRLREKEDRLRNEAIPRRECTSPAPLSFAQQRLWFFDRLEPNSSLYNIPFDLRLTGWLDVGILERCLSEIVRRHEALRTTFATVNAEPVQCVAGCPGTGSATPLTLPLTDLSGLPEAERETAIRRILVEEARRPFDLSRDSMLRAGLLRLGEQEHVCFLTIHHIAVDGWSYGILFRELTALYTAFSRGQPSPLKDLSIQYADFAVWQRKWLQGPVLDEQLAYWKSRLEGAPPVLELPMDHPRPAMQTYCGAEECLVFDEGLWERLRQLSRREGATPFMTLLAAFQTLLYRYSGQEDLVLGTPIAGRNRLETEELIGFFVNTLALRTDLSGNPPFRELLARTREATVGAFAHQDLPFEKLVEELKPERNLSYPPLCQVMFALQNTPREPLRIPGLRVRGEAVESVTAKFDLTLSMNAEGEGLRGVLEYNTDLFERATIQRMLGHFQRLLEAIVADPEQRIGELPLLTEAERRQLLVEWNDTWTDYPRDRCVHELFERQVEQTPEAVAVVFGDQQLTYRELNCRANQLAHHLQDLGVAPGAFVATCFERSAEMVVAVLAILKAGGAYVPLDPEFPQQRLGFMLQDAAAQVVLSHRPARAKVPAGDLAVVCLDRDGARIAACSPHTPPPAVGPRHPACVMYTSGSTGQPKGVGVPHRAIVRLVRNTNYVELGPNETFMQFAPLAFDASTFEIWAPLLNGGRLAVLPPGLPALKELGDFIQRNGITTAFLSTGLFHALAEENVDCLLGLKQLLVGGEVLSRRHAIEAVQRLPACRLSNIYGPTENTTFSTWYAMPAPNSVRDSVPIGRPIANSQAYVLDDRRQLVPVGVPGELYLGGDGLAAGYHNRPELTAERFVADPFGDEPGARLYKTGDLVRWLPDGNLEFLGRRDQQVKIRGFRVELGEIESCLRRHPAIQDAVVLAREDSPGEKRLAAYLVAKDREMPGAMCSWSVAELRSHVEKDLPEFMVPAAFLTLAALPLTPNGKVDRRALPAPDQWAHGGYPLVGAGRPDRGAVYVPPRDAVEKQVAAIWADLLGVERVGVHDNFFELGGHSLLAMRMLARVQESCGKELPAVAVFCSPTVAQLALVLHGRMDVRPTAAVREIQPGGSKPPLFFVPSVGGKSVSYWSMVQHLGPDQPVLSIGFPDPEQPPRPFETFEDFALWCVEKIREARPVGPYSLVGYSFAGMLAYEVARQLQATGSEVRVLAILDTGPQRKQSFSRRLQYPGRVLMNVPLWITEHVLRTSLRDNAAQLKRSIKAWTRRGLALTGLIAAARVEVEDILRVEGLTPAYRKLLDHNLQLFRAYAPKPYPGRITLFRARARDLFHPADRDLGWGEFAAGGVEVNDVPGSHGALFRDPIMSGIGEQLAERLSKVT